MELKDFLTEDSFRLSSEEDWKKLLDYLQFSTNDVKFLSSHESHCKTLIYNIGFEIFDKLVEICIAGEDDGISTYENLVEATEIICKHARPRELNMMAIEKLSHGSHMSEKALSLVLIVLNHAIVRMGTIECITNGLSLITHNLTMSEMGFNPSYITVVLTFASELKNSYLSIHSKKFIPFNDIFIGFLLNLCSKCISKVQAPPQRKSLTARVTIMVSTTASSFEDIFSFAFRARYRIYTYHRALARLESNLPHSHEESSNNLESSNLLLCDYIQHVICHPLPEEFGDATDSASLLLLDSISNNYMIPWDLVTDEELDKMAHIPERDSGSLDVDVDTDEAYDENNIRYHNRRQHKSARKSLDFHPNFEWIPWSMVGVSMIAHCFLCQESHFPIKPLVYSDVFLWKFCNPFLLTLLRHPILAKIEGIEFFNSLVSSFSGITKEEWRNTCLSMKKSARSSSTLPLTKTKIHEGIGPLLFLSKGVASISLEKLFFTCFRSEQGLKENHRDCGINLNVCQWRNRKLLASVASAMSFDVLSVAQQLINSLVSHPSESGRRESFASFRTWLSSVEERSRMSLLFRLVNDCPFPYITALLLDVVKEYCQLATKNQDFGPFSISPRLYLRSAQNANEEILSKVKYCEDCGDESNAEIFDMAIVMYHGRSPFLSPLVLILFTYKVLRKVPSMSFDELIERVDELISISNIIRFFHLCIQSRNSIACFSSLSSSSLSNTDLEINHSHDIEAEMIEVSKIVNEASIAIREISKNKSNIPINMELLLFNLQSCLTTHS